MVGDKKSGAPNGRKAALTHVRTASGKMTSSRDEQRNGNKWVCFGVFAYWVPGGKSEAAATHRLFSPFAVDAMATPNGLFALETTVSNFLRVCVHAVTKQQPATTAVGPTERRAARPCN
ncbi:hypothetical protein PIIN_06845 [Serendipita indica DSM 11827]|uniref:Uncharacterized protein n=1 Tax=Serendipita indica (strain DSM 11827) TaxID=1109443 RepID=G4TNL6_SERID|nr:hypothetical protein PIIN_06845 [Serendipita indica DSM 11827]